MSLQVWLPLTKDLRNQGLATITSTGTPVFKNIGKIGSKSLDLNTRINFNCTALANIQTFSIAFWAKTNQDSNITGDWMDVLGFTDVSASGSSGQLRWETCYTYGAPTRGVSAHDNATYATVQGPSGQASIKGNWNHFCITVDPLGTGRAVEYQDGVKIGDYAANGGHLTGSFWTGETNKVNGEIQDIRIYNHALSQMEVKELAKGLVLHYPLDRQGWGQENLGNFASVVSNWTMESLSGSNYTDSSYGNVIKLVTNSTNQRMYNYVPAAMWQSGKVYTVSFLAKADTNGRTCDMSRSIADFSPSFTLTTNWKKYSGKITSTATPNGGTLSFRIHQSGATVYITQIKVEEGALATPYCPHYNDSLYTTMGLNSTIEYDCSGFCNNGTRTGTFTWTSDTPKYQVSTNFNGSNNQIHLDGFGIGNIFSIACWVKVSDASGTKFIFQHGTTSGYNNTQFGIHTSSEGNSYGIIVNKQYSSISGLSSITNWHHMVLTFDGTTAKYYFNGELKHSYTVSNALYSGTKLSLGAYSSNGNVPYKGLMSDFRIYATALSADDVKSLYQNSAYIDSSGNVYGAVHTEV